MPLGQTIRVRVAAPPTEARRLCTRLTRGGIPAELDDGSSRAEVLVAVDPGTDLTQFRGRVGWLVVLGTPGAAYFAAGADDVVMPGEPELLFRRLRAVLERLDLVSRVERLNERVTALEAGLADAAHDVRSPLQAVIGNAELLARDSSLTPAQRACAAACARQGVRAMQLAERILEAAKQRSRDVLAIGAVDLGGLVEAAVAQAQALATQQGVTLTAVPPSRPVEIRADGQLLARVLDNLIANAIRFSPRGGVVEAEAWRASPRFVRLSVKDQGDGIAPTELPKLIAGPSAVVATERAARLRRHALAARGVAHAEDRLRRSYRQGLRGAHRQQAYGPGPARPRPEAGQEAGGAAERGQGRPGAGHRAAEPDGGIAARPHACAPRRLNRVIVPACSLRC